MQIETIVAGTESNGTQQLIQLLKEKNVDTVFTTTNEILLSIHQSIQETTELIHMFLKHEQAVVHAADGYARASGKVGVVFVSSGPGLTNTITSLATAYIDSIPLVVIVSQLSTSGYELDRLHHIDVPAMMMSVSKYCFRVSSISELHGTLTDAFTLSIDKRPGPVVIEVPEDILISKNFLIEHDEGRNQGNKTTYHIKDSQIKNIYDEIQAAKKPILFIGGGVVLSGAAKELATLANTLQIPVVSTLMGLGSIPSNHPLFLGMLGMHGTFAANKAVHHADLLICLGVRFSDRVTGNIKGFSPHSKKIQIDIDPAEVNKNIRVDISIIGDVKDCTTRLNKLIKPRGKLPWTEEVTTWKKEVPRYKTTKSLLKPQEVIKLLDKYTESHAVVATDVGQHQIWTAHNYCWQFPRQLITSGGLGTMGFGLPAAIGAAMAKPDHTILCVSGDGSIQMNIQELITAVHYRLPIKIAILKNGYLGMVRQWQEMFYDSRYSSVKITSPSFVKIAEAHGATGFYAKNQDEAERIISRAMKIEGPVIMEFDVTEEENVYPIVPPGLNNIDTVVNK